MTVRLVLSPLDAEIVDVSQIEYHFNQDRIVLGRSRGADVRLPHAGVSTHHATLHRQGDNYVIVDNGSTNGTFVNGLLLTPMKPKALRSEDLIGIGHFGIVFQLTTVSPTLTTLERSAELARRILRELRNDRSPAATSPYLKVTAGAQEGRTLGIPPPPCRLIIGRSEQCDLPLSDADTSREHVEVISTLEGCFAKDLGSRNGMLVNGKQLNHRLLSDSDCIQIGNTAIVYVDPADAHLKALEALDDQPLAKEAPTEAISALIENKLTSCLPEPVPKGAPESLSQIDFMIYVVAAIIIGLSIAGLIVLLANP
ncbi:MAG: FHA domain-containing protein [Myxococcales bacterium]|nr:FHA domain-containing protein [Myxococcales bacterium]